MRSGLLTLISMTVFVWNAFAQDQVAPAKYELIRETINFLATDKVVSQDTNFSISCETLDYDCFAQQLSSKPIAGIESWYNSWRSMTATDTVELKALRDQLFADIFERPGKGYRKQLAGYEGYISRTEYLISQYANGMPLEEITLDTASAPSDSIAGMYPAETEQLTDKNDNPEKENTMIGYFALIIGIIALAIAALPIFKKKDQQPPADFQGLADRLDELSMRMKRLERQAAADPQTKDAITSLTDIMEAVEQRVVVLENRSKSAAE